MAKKLIHYYTFDPAARSVKVKGNIASTRLLLITNVTDNVNIYSFSDNSLGLDSRTYDTASDETTFIINFATGSMNASDELQIFYEKDYVNIEPSETYVDAVSKFRVSNPENLIDTDFEYGPQSSKWETLQTINNIPSFYASTADTTIPFIDTVGAILDSEIITVTTQYDHNLQVGVPITVTGLSSVTAEGAYLIQSVPSTTTFTYKARANQPATTLLQGTYTSIIPGQFFQGSQVNLSASKGITSDYFEKVVTVKPVQVLTVTADLGADITINTPLSTSGGALATVVAVGGDSSGGYAGGSTLLTIANASGTFTDGDTVDIQGTEIDYVIAAGGVGTTSNKYFIDEVLTPRLDLARGAIYVFDQSSSTNTTHQLEFADAQDVTSAGNAGNVLSQYVYVSGTAGSAGAYTRVYVTSSSPSYNNLWYNCVNHQGMGDYAVISYATQTKVMLTTKYEHGFADDTNFYFVNTVSPKVLEIPDSTADEPGNVNGWQGTGIANEIVETLAQASGVLDVDETKVVPYNYESTYTKRFDESDINYSTDTINIDSHGFHDKAAVLYYPNPGDTPIAGLARMQVYYIQKIDDNNFKLNHSMRLNYTQNLSTGGTFTFGNHNVGLVYNIYEEYKAYSQWYTYLRTYYIFGNTYSGWDFSNIDSNYGLGRQNWDITVHFSTNRQGSGNSPGPGFGASSNWYWYNWSWRQYYGTFWQTYGYHRQSLPLGTDQWQGTYDFLTDHENQGVNGQNNGNHSHGYTTGNGNGNNVKTYWTDNFYTQHESSGQNFRIRGSTHFHWYHNVGHGSTLSRSFGSSNSDGQTNMYIMLAKRNTSTNDSFYAENHGLVTNSSATQSGSGNIHYYYNNAGNRSTYSAGTVWYMDKIDSNRFRIKTSTGASPLRLAGIDGTIGFTAVINNPFADSIFIANNQFSAGELLKYDTTGTEIGGLTNGTSYYVYPITGNRFQLAASQGGSIIDITSQGTGSHTFENTTADFGVVDGSYTTTKAVSETELQVTIPFKIPPTNKSFNAGSNIANNQITINNHFFGSGTKVIYDAGGNTAISGLTDGKDYFVSQIDHNTIEICDTEADALAAPPVNITISSGSGFHKLISSNLSGEVTGPGSLTVESGSRKIIGSSSAFQRFFKIGDVLRIVNPATTPGVIIERKITAVTDDDNLLVDIDLDFTGSSIVYLIPSYIYVRPDGFYLHRPFDGGMEIGTSKSPNSRISRQTRKYFRYQSGKGIQTSYAINFIPLTPILDLTYVTGPKATASEAISAAQNSTELTVADSSVYELHMFVTGSASIVSGTRISQIKNATTVVISNALTAPISGTTITFHQLILGEVRCSKPHNFTVGLKMKVINSDDVAFNNESFVNTVIDEFRFQYLLESTPAISSSGGFPQAQVLNWSGCDIRAGMFDEQNGFYYEFDGNTINCVRRSSVLQLPGLVSVENNSNIIIGTDTKFTSEIIEGENIVVRGMTYRVVKVTSNTQLTVQPSYRGITTSEVICTKTVDTKVPQAEWNLDKADGDGPSGYTLDITKIQMCYMDYSWYGAGKIRFGFKDQNGHVKYVHQFKHNNKLTESYFRSGNLPARYEIENSSSPTFTGTLFHWGTSVIMDGMYQDDEAYLFTAAGNVQKFTNATAVDVNTNSNSTIQSEWSSWYNRKFFIRIPFASSDAGSLPSNSLIFHSSAASGYFANGRSIDPRTRTSGSTHFVYIQYLEGTTEEFPWNYASVINTKIGNPAVNSSTTFGVGAPSGTDNSIPTDIPLISIRLAPSVDSSITGALGEREIINRMQLSLSSLGILTTHDTELTLKLNAQLNTDAYQNVQEPSLCQLVKHAPDDIISGGSGILSLRAAGAGNGQTQATNFDLTDISDLGNSILGGDGTFPNGPDILTIIANVVDSSDVSINNPYSVSARVTWKESQA